MYSENNIEHFLLCIYNNIYWMDSYKCLQNNWWKYEIIVGKLEILKQRNLDISHPPFPQTLHT